MDQKRQPGKENHGIRALPNLETKFVSANTLIGLERQQQTSLKNPDIDRLEDNLNSLRHQYFSAKTRKEKLSCQKKDNELRREIADLLVNDGWSNESAHLVAAFDPYDQNASSPFFDIDWMFGLKDGFDVVIGNPPYVRVDAISVNEKQCYKKRYKSSKGKYDLYYLFFEKSITLLKKPGCCIFITPNKYCAASSASVLRKILFCSQSTCEIMSTSKLGVFERSVETVNHQS